MIRWLSTLLCFSCSIIFSSSPAALTSEDLIQRSKEMLFHHAVYKQVTPELAGRILTSFLDELDPLKLYFLEEEVSPWATPSQETLEIVISTFSDGNDSVFRKIMNDMAPTIERRAEFEARLQRDTLPPAGSYRTPDSWARTPEELYQRVRTLRSAQMEAAGRLGPDLASSAIVRMEKRRMFFEEERTPNDPLLFEQTVATFLLKAFASALDSESAYFTPAEAQQLLVGMQHRLFGIGVMLRDDFDGFTVLKLVEGGPAARRGGLEVGDKIIAVNDDPVIGLELPEMVELVRGNPGSSIVVKVLRKQSGSTITREVRLLREAVVVKDLRYKTAIRPADEGVIACLQLRSFYQDESTSSYDDLISSLKQLEKKHPIKGVILDLRYNPGGLLSQGVAVASLFLDKGIIVSLKEGSGVLTHMRNLSHNKAWDGPLIVLINRASASASEIVAQTLQDWGRAIIVGETSFGKGSFQLLTMNTQGLSPSPRGEFKVTQGRYYTVSGKSPQLIGVQPDITIPSSLAFAEIGERYNKYPLPQDTIASNFSDNFEDVSVFQRPFLHRLYEKSHQERLDFWTPLLPQLRKLSEQRVRTNEAYQKMLQAAQTHHGDLSFDENKKEPDFQLEEAWNIMADILGSCTLQKAA